MTTGERMKLRRKELGIPVDYVAAALGVSIATVYRYEKGDIEKVPGTALEPLAKVLQTTAAWLMGWSDEVNVSASSGNPQTSNTISPIQDGSPIHLSISDTDPQIDAILRNARKLNAQGLERLEAYSDDLAGNPKYLKQKVPLTIAARGGDVIDTSQVDVTTLVEGLKDIDPIDSL